jgi:histidinol phosphatase-like PHP family hydrolase
VTAWQPVDCHAHTTWSDGTLEVAELVERVRERGVRPGVADHVSRDVAYSVKSVEAAREYVALLEEYPVARGAEFCWHDDLWRELPHELLGRLTHRIGSLHGIFLPAGGHLHLWSRTLPDGLTAAAYMDIHLDNVERFAAEMPVDILAHPTLVALSLRDRPGEELWSEAHEERMVRALAAAGIAFELSMRYPPHERLVRRAQAAGVRFSLGSDGHTAEQVGDLDGPLTLARAVGVEPAALFDPWQHAEAR